MKIPCVMFCIMLSLFLVEAEVSVPTPAPAPAPAPAAESCNVMEMVSCAYAFTTLTPPSQECCDTLKEQKPPCICQYIKDPALAGFINTTNAKMWVVHLMALLFFGHSLSVLDGDVYDDDSSKFYFMSGLNFL
ncbi:hypothetical protein CR513_32402, partial [Mucuna pruriens]